jgi:hypothetical protein
MSYFVIFEPSSGTFYGLSTFEPVGLSEQYKIEAREGYLPRDVSLWDPASRSFVKASITISRLQFLSRFTAQERIAIRQLAASDLVVDDFMKLLDISQDIDMSSEMVGNGLNYLLYKGILSAERVIEIGE